VIVLSSLHRDKKCQEKSSKPEMITFYNQTKGGVDALDERIATYSTKLTTRRWHAVVFFDMLDISLFNAFVLHKAVNPDYHRGNSSSRRVFLKHLGKALLQANITRRAVSRSVQPAALLATSLSPASKRGRCKICPREKDAKTANICATCHSFVCKEHLRVICDACYI
jgi:hypothetical protein